MMTANSTLYHINEGDFLLPDGTGDKTVNAFLNFAGLTQCSLNISRDELQEKENLEVYIARQVKELKKQLTSYVRMDEKSVLLGQGEQAIHGTQIESRFMHNQITVYQWQAGFVLADKTVLIFTLTCRDRVPSSLLPHWQRLLTDFVLRA